jgi:hypothetical protein
MTHTDLHSFLSDTAGLGRTTTLFRKNGLRTLLLHLKAGEEVPEHQTRGAIMVHCLKGCALGVCGTSQGTPVIHVALWLLRLLIIIELSKEWISASRRILHL